MIETDVCIIGGGAAGITLAREFIGQPYRVCLLESGGLEFEPETQALYKGENVGRSYFPLDASRLRLIAVNSSALVPSFRWMFAARSSATVVSQRASRPPGL